MAGYVTVRDNIQQVIIIIIILFARHTCIGLHNNSHKNEQLTRHIKLKALTVGLTA